MKFFTKNSFTAPDIKDVLQNKHILVRNLAIILSSGVVLASTLVGGYHIGQWFLGTTTPGGVFVAPEIPTTSTLTIAEQRLAELGGTQTGGEYDISEVEHRMQELQSEESIAQESKTSATEYRLKELGG